MTPEELGEYVCNAVKKGDPNRFLFISAKGNDGADVDVCHTGNGPRGPANTRLIARAPDLAAEVLALRAKLAEAREDAIREAAASAASPDEDDDRLDRQCRIIIRDQILALLNTEASHD